MRFKKQNNERTGFYETAKFKTKYYEYPVELSLDESGNTVIYLNVN